jgi:hypothetical protein
MGFTIARRRFLLLTCAGLAATGLAWSWIDLRHGLGPVDDPLLQSARAWLGRTHGAFAMLGLAAMGAVAVTHMRCTWRAGLRRASGIALAALSGTLAISSYALYYGSDDSLRAASACAHIAAGVAAIAVFALHWLARTRFPQADRLAVPWRRKR